MDLSFPFQREIKKTLLIRSCLYLSKASPLLKLESKVSAQIQLKSDERLMAPLPTFLTRVKSRAVLQQARLVLANGQKLVELLPLCYLSLIIDFSGRKLVFN